MRGVKLLLFGIQLVVLAAYLSFNSAGEGPVFLILALVGLGFGVAGLRAPD